MKKPDRRISSGDSRLLPTIRLVFSTKDRRSKRIFDLIGASAAIVLTSPLMLGIALAIKLSSRGPVLFHQFREGEGGKTFKILKFRTMKVVKIDSRWWSVVSGDQVTTVGKLLRKTSLDELPQLFNVLSGKMSLVGPRPERTTRVEAFTAEYPGYSTRDEMPMGMTGLSQVHGLRGDTSIPDRAKFDNYYIDHWSIRGDLKILFQTIREVFHHNRDHPSTSGHPGGFTERRDEGSSLGEETNPD